VTAVNVTGISPAVGFSSQFKAVATRSDGTTSTVTSQAGWGSSNSSAAVVDSGGIVSAIGLGSVEISAIYAGLRGSMTFTVAPVVTYTIRGVVLDASSNLQVPSTVVTFVGDHGSKLAISDGTGSYSIGGVPAGNGTLTASTSGYATSSQSVGVQGDVTANFRLSPSACPTISFDSQQIPDAPFSTATECGFVVRATTSNWIVWTMFGKPAPSIVFKGVGASTSAEVQVTAGGAPFSFESVDLYSSVTPVPYVITGIRNSNVVFTLQNLIGGGGLFWTFTNPQSAVAIDTLVIRLTNPADRNPMGLDNLRLTR